MDDSTDAVALSETGADHPLLKPAGPAAGGSTSAHGMARGAAIGVGDDGIVESTARCALGLGHPIPACTFVLFVVCQAGVTVSNKTEDIAWK